MFKKGIYCLFYCIGKIKDFYAHNIYDTLVCLKKRVKCILHILKRHLRKVHILYKSNKNTPSKSG